MMKSLLVGTAVFIAGFVATCVAIRVLVGDPMNLYAEQRSEKLAVLAHEGTGVCSAAFGSSHIHNGFDPRVFDQSLSAQGFNVYSINLAIEGGSQTEQFAMAERFLRTRTAEQLPGHRCVIALEINAGVNFADRHLVHPRSINIYDSKVASVGASFTSPAMPRVRKAGRLGFIAAATSMHYLNVATLANKLFPHADDQELIKRESDEGRRGFLTEPNNPRDTAAVNDLLEVKPVSATSSAAELSRGAGQLIRSLSAEPNGSSVDYVYLVSPALQDLVHYETYPTCLSVDGRRVMVIDVALPALYPELYRAALWHDPTHLNASGAAIFTRLVADRLAAQLSASTDACASI